MNKETQSIVTGMLGGLLVSITLSGRFTSYVKPGFRPVLLTAGILLIVVAVVSLALAVLDDTKKSRPVVSGAPDEEPVTHPAHEHGTRAPWLVLVPVLVLLFVAPPALGADAASRGISCGTAAPAATTYPSRRTTPSDALPAGNPVPLTMQEFVSRSLYDSLYSTANVDIQVTAFIAESSCDGAGYSLVRLKISCCAADAFALRAHVDAPPPYPANTWVQATIRAVENTGDQANNYVPAATVIAMTTIPQPADPYET
jgi:uncharacterized repeat protein (TIGR03943 family)